ncbi:hypothetical protein [Oceanobacillus chungangensis]|uniref:HNH endonuclease n=1 Tax=Oceanobacillus chungangensis TaxID=1229152 RepID=A0A3D8PNW6_9BACI|nr:hypothetical protein [Oceanobacillus chungangensis]RDW17664.1 hypothetical protein CWR45_09975 [Oceanobacillus chungangensis]
MKIKTQYYFREIRKNEKLEKPGPELTREGFFTDDLTEKVLEEGPVYSEDFLLVGVTAPPREIWILEPNQEVNVLTFDLEFLDADPYSDPNKFYETNREYFKEYEVRDRKDRIIRKVTFDLDKIRERDYDAIKANWWALKSYFNEQHRLSFYSGGSGGNRKGGRRNLLWVKWGFKELVHKWCNLPDSQNEGLNNNAITTVELEEELALNKYDDSELDKKGEITYRVEHKDLRKHLFKGKISERCGICGKEYPVNLLVAAHIKKRAECKPHEKKDKNIVMPMCTFGCDDLYERGYISVKNGKIVANNQKHLTDDVREYIKKIENKECAYYNRYKEKYFLWHNDYHHIK